MHRSHHRLAAVVAAALLLGACAGTTTDDPPVAAEPAATGDTADDAGSDDVATVSDGDVDAATAAVLAATATAPDGTTFTIGDFVDGPVLVETFATWCSTCRRQLVDTQQAAVELGDDVPVLVLSVETGIDPATLGTYAEEHGFTDMVFGVLDAQGLAALDAAFGRTVLNPPSTPKFRVGADGTLSPLTTGFESVEELLASFATA